MPLSPLQFLFVLCIVAITACENKSDTGSQQPIDLTALISDDQKVYTTKSGLQYIVVKEGSGASPTEKDSVTVNYRGAFLSGANFDSANGITFGLNRIIPGWTEGLQLMKEGAKYRLIVPPELAYGERGAGNIGPNQALIFDVELVNVVPLSEG